MRLNIYKNKHATEYEKTMELSKVFKLIETQASNVIKSERLGIVYASTSKRGRKHEDILEFTGIAFIDVDDCSEPKKVKELFAEIDCTIATWYSTSGNVHALIKIPVCKTKDEFKRRYELLTSDLRDEIGDWGKLDSITINPTQLAFISHDTELFVNEEPTTYEGIYLPNKPKQNRTISFDFYNDASTKWCISKAQDWFNDILDNGYPQVLRYAITLGGWSSAGYIEPSEALDVLKTLTRCNPYLNSRDSSGSIETYLKAVESSFNEGLEHPLHWS